MQTQITRITRASRRPALTLENVLPALLLTAVGLVMLPKALEFAGHSWEVLLFPWQIDYDEGVNLNASWLLSRGVNIYKPNTADHFISALYPPLFYMFNAAAIKLWGVNLWSGRLLTLAGSIAAGAALWAWVYAETKRHTAGLVAALLWFSLAPVYIWSTFYKQDVPAIGLGLVGGAMVARWAARRQDTPAASADLPGVQLKTRNRTLAWSRGSKLRANLLLYLAIVPLALSFWMKQSSVAPMLAVGLFLLLRNWRVGLRWGAWAAASIVGPLLAMQALSRGGMLEHLLAFNAFGRSTGRLLQRLDTLWTDFWPLVICGAVFLSVALVRAAQKRIAPPLSAVYLLTAIPFTLIALLHPTGNYNQLLNILAPLCLAVGVSAGAAWHRLAGVRGRGKLMAAVALGGALVLILAQAALTYGKPIWRWYTPLAMPLPQRAERMQQLEKAVQSVGGPVLSEDAWLLLKNGKEVLYDDPAAMAALARSRAWDESVLIQDLSRRKFLLIMLQYDATGVTYSPRWSEAGLEALQSNYATQYRDVYFTYLPRPPGATPQVVTACTLEGGPVLEGFTFNSRQANPGDSLPLSLYWRQTGTGGRDPSVKFFVRLVDSAGTVKWQADWQPGEAAGKPWSAGAWKSGETLRDSLYVPVAANTPPGLYRLQAGVYTQSKDGKVATLLPKCSGSTAVAPAGTVTIADLSVVERWSAR